MNRYEQHIDDLLSKEDYILGKDLNDNLKQKFELSNGYERKIVQRAVDLGIIHSSSPVSFGNGQYAYLHSTKFLDHKIILKITKENRPPLYRIIKMMDHYNGVISVYEAFKLSAAPLDKGKNKSDSIEKLIEELRHLKLGEEVLSKNGVKFIVKPILVNSCEKELEEQEQRMAIDTMFIPDILKSLRSYNIIDNNRIIYRNKQTPGWGISHNNFIWDAIAYTKTTGINEVRASEADTFEKQTLVALDIVVSRPYKDEDLQGFLSRIQSTLYSVKTGKRKILPIVIYCDTESKILVNKIRKLGFLSFDLGSIYGSKIFQIIKDIFALKQKELTDHTDIEPLIESTLSTIRMAGQEDNLHSLKGDLFESLMFPVFQNLFHDSYPDQGRNLKEKKNGNEEKYEYDYIINSARLREIIVIELKGYSSSKYISLGDDKTKNTINWFFRRTLPFARKKLRENNQDYRITGCYITTSKFNADGLEALEKLNISKLKPSQMDCWYDGEKLLKLLEHLKLTKVKEIITKYYIKKGDEAVDDRYDEYNDEFQSASTNFELLSEEELPF